MSYSAKPMGYYGALGQESETFRFGRDEPLLTRRHRKIAALLLWRGDIPEGLAHARRLDYTQES